MSAKIKHILFPTDFSEAADNAFRYCLEFAKLWDAEISVLHIYSLPVIQDFSLPDTLKGIYEDIYVEEFTNFQDEIPHLQKIVREMGIKELTINYILQEGHDIPSIILEQQEKVNADILVMGTQGASIIERYFLGNNTSNVMESSTIPVLGVPPNAKVPAEIKSVVMCTDYSEDDKKVLKILKEFFPKYANDIDTLHIKTSASAAKPGMAEEWDQFATKEEVGFTLNIAESLVKGIMDYDEEKGIDLLVMRTHKKNAIFNIFNRYTAKDIIYSKTVPLLAMPEKYWHDKV